MWLSLLALLKTKSPEGNRDMLVTQEQDQRSVEVGPRRKHHFSWVSFVWLFRCCFGFVGFFLIMEGFCYQMQVKQTWVSPKPFGTGFQRLTPSYQNLGIDGGKGMQYFEAFAGCFALRHMAGTQFIHPSWNPLFQWELYLIFLHASRRPSLKHSWQSCVRRNQGVTSVTTNWKEQRHIR